MNFRERDFKDSDWRDRELKELAKSLRMEADVEEEMVKASFLMEFYEILDTHSVEYNEGFIAGWNGHIDQGVKLSEISKEFFNNLHNIYDTWLKDNDPATPRKSVT